ncbi:MAG: hypothetical protein M3Y82_08900 [Verrucomicrobiota bacterium]|nr:hypothetical protein [Verrucomicrobiota bacterium]
MDIEEIRARVQSKQIVFTQHADAERRKDSLAFREIFEAVLSAACSRTI